MRIILSVCLSLLFATFCFGQSTSARAGVGNNQITPLCQNEGISTADCSACWNYYDSSGCGSGSATADYGILQAFASAHDLLGASIGGGYSPTTAYGGSDFSDELTFSGLNGDAILQASITVNGSVTGDSSAAAVGAQVDIRNNSKLLLGECSIQSFKGKCSAKVPISSGDAISLIAHLSASVAVIAPNCGGCSDQATIDYRIGKGGKVGGAQVSLTVVDAKGRTVKGVTILTASGAVYPNR